MGRSATGKKIFVNFKNVILFNAMGLHSVSLMHSAVTKPNKKPFHEKYDSATISEADRQRIRDETFLIGQV